MSKLKHNSSNKDDLDTIEKNFKRDMDSISRSIYQEVIIVLRQKFSKESITGNCKIDVNNNEKKIVIKNSEMFNFLSSTKLYNIQCEGKSFIISDNNLKSDSESIKKREQYIKSILIASINNNKSFKVDKINYKNMSDEDISSLKKENKNKEEAYKRIENMCKMCKVSSTI